MHSIVLESERKYYWDEKYTGSENVSTPGEALLCQPTWVNILNLVSNSPKHHILFQDTYPAWSDSEFGDLMLCLCILNTTPFP